MLQNIATYHPNHGLLSLCSLSRVLSFIIAEYPLAGETMNESENSSSESAIQPYPRYQEITTTISKHIQEQHDKTTLWLYVVAGKEDMERD